MFDSDGKDRQRLINVEAAVARLEKALNYNSSDGLNPDVEEWTPVAQRIENIEAAVARIEKAMNR